MEYSLVQIAQGAGVFIGAMGVAVYGLKKNGKITFGKSDERRACVRVCSEHEGLVKAVAANGEKIDVVDGKVDRILGHLGKL